MISARNFTALGMLATLAACSWSGNDSGILGAGTAPAAVAAPFLVKVIGFNDFHGSLESSGTFGQATAAADKPAVGGADYLAGHIARLKALNPLNVVVGAGDLIGASPLISAFFNDEPAIEALNRAGLEFTSVGNHEFDKGAAELLRMQAGGCRVIDGRQDPNSCKGAAVGTPVPFEGAKFSYLSANVISTATGKPLLPAYGTKTFNGVKMAFIGMTLKATPTIVTPTGVAGLEFRDEAQTVNSLIPELRSQGIEAIAVLVHEGGVQTGSLGDIDGCEGNLARSAIAKIVSQLDEAVDLVISGHTHAAYNCKLPNAKGRSIPVTSANSHGRLITDVDVTIEPATKDITAVSATNRLVARNDGSVMPDPGIGKIVAAYRTLVEPLANAVIGSIRTALPSVRIDGACTMPAGNLIADSALYATRPASSGGAEIAFMNGGGVRSHGYTFASSAVREGDGNVTYGEAFTVQPFGNSLVTMTLTAQDIKDVLEEQFAGCKGQSATASKFMLPSAGFKYSWNGAGSCNARISNVTLTQDGSTVVIVDAAGVVTNPTRTFRVTVNNFMADGGDGYSTFKSGANRLGGGRDVDALVSFLAQYKSPRGAYDPAAIVEDRGTPRINRVGAGNICPTGTDVDP
nr:5'-nucleotidase C-terminal domain-containing protein [uncultured Noviherbaspirillum sp.]